MTTDNKPVGNDLLASVVVFLVALPLCMGIAVASGVPPALGLVTGIIGGIVVGSLAGQPLQVSGPAAGLAVMVWELVDKFGLGALGLAVLLAGLIQVAAAYANFGRWFRAVSPAVIQGMLAGIGVLIFASQFHVMVDDKPSGSGWENLASIPQAIYKAVFPLDGSVHQTAAAIGVLTILGIVLWDKFKPARLRMLPGALVGVVLATATTAIAGLSIAKVTVPSNLASSLNWINAESLSLLGNGGFWAAVVGLAVIASAEALLCATATDRLHDGDRTDYNKELRAQGVGNMLCGVVGALPVTGVIVRSSANVAAGGRTKWSAILHGIWILVLVVAFPQVLGMIPMAALAAILVYTGWKLLNVAAAKKLLEVGRSELFIWGATVTAIVVTDLLVGIVTGFALAAARLLLAFTRLEVDIEQDDDANITNVHLHGAATFVSLPKLAEGLERIPASDREVHFHIDDVSYIDHACIELIETWVARYPGKVVIEVHHLAQRSQSERPLQLVA